ncbi:MAG: photosystem I assembly protein Ycf4 [Spirulinaceae cyanobacterium SM2_1_0]|nr:photosystem I assembly protein Ycf4 [Spirulinaceae cyanobacterium SM2_1_0]
MTVTAASQEGAIFRQDVLGSRRFSNYFWALICTIGGVGFLLAGLSSYFKINFLVVSDPTDLIFVPQGIALLFYGLAGSGVALYQGLAIAWDIGGGYNEFNKQTGKATVFRWGFPGENRRIELCCKLDDIQAVRAEIREGFNPKRALYLRVSKQRDIPLSRVGAPLSLAELENQGAELARFLTVPLEGL